MRVTCFVLATECLTMNVACNLQLVCSFPCIMLMQYFVLLLPFGVRVILSHWKLNAGDFSIHWKFPPDTILWGFFDIIFASSYYLLIFLNPNTPTLESDIFVKIGPQQPTFNTVCSPFLHLSLYPLLLHP